MILLQATHSSTQGVAIRPLSVYGVWIKSEGVAWAKISSFLRSAIFRVSIGGLEVFFRKSCDIFVAKTAKTCHFTLSKTALRYWCTLRCDTGIGDARCTLRYHAIQQNKVPLLDADDFKSWGCRKLKRGNEGVPMKYMSIARFTCVVPVLRGCL